MTVSEAKAAEPRLYTSWGKDCGGLEAEGVEGLFLVLKREGEYLPDYAEDLVPDAIIAEILVFDPDRTDSGGLVL